MKLLYDLFPVILFFASFKYAEKNPEQAADWASQLLGATPASQAPILLATLVVMLATLAQIGWTYLRHGRVEKMLWISLALVTGLGSLTLIFHNEDFIKWKPTVLYWVMAGGMLTATFLKKNAIRLMLQDKLELPEPAWLRLNLAWIAFLTGMGLLNLYVAFNYSTDTWVNFKLFGGMGLLLLFMLAQGVYLSRYIKEETP
ncbi:septation protein A [Azovibrio restrictus]|uniref:septation protein A n=1 Tax=Azovibrio restrictus TaxID=146938 RepID=UPI0004244178|nr:septation protein A [Azovibrio restrictus]MCE1172089.1 septation protein A [Azovibrio sp.]